MRCAIYGCNSNNRAKYKKSELSFFCFPKDEIVCKMWLYACCRSDPMKVENSRICSKHFKVDDFLLTSSSQGRIRLKKGATPSLLLPFPITMAIKNEQCPTSSDSGVNNSIDRENNGIECNLTSNEEFNQKANVFVENTPPVRTPSIMNVRSLESDEIEELNKEKHNDLQEEGNQLDMDEDCSPISEIVQESPTFRSSHQCGVPQCRIRRGANVSMFRIPKYIRNNPSLLEKWSNILRMEKPFPKNFEICNLHFEKNQILTPIKRGDKRSYRLLVENAVPSLHLPKPKSMDKQISQQLLEQASCVVRRRPCEVIQKDPLSDETENEMNICTKSTQVDFNRCIVFSSFCDTDTKLNAMTGLDDISCLDSLINKSLQLRKEDSVHMSMRDRIILTMCKLKTNLDFEQMGVLFKINKKTTAFFFADTIKHLAQLIRPLIYWPSKEKNIKTLPQPFKYFPNVRIIVQCIQINIHPQLSVLVGFAPSGFVIYLSDVFNGSISTKDMFLQTELLQLFKPDDVVMIDSEFYIQDTHSIGRIKMVTLDGDHEQNRIGAAKAHIEMRIEKLKKFKVLCEGVDESLIPFIKHIMIVLCGLSNVNLNKS